MMRNSVIIAATVSAVVCVSMFAVITRSYSGLTISDTALSAMISNHKPLDAVTYLEEDLLKIKQQRDSLSKTLVKLSKVHHQLQCDMIPDSSDQNEISSHGGWCTKTLEIRSYRLDTGLFDTLIPIFRGQTVVSFGEGPGLYKKAFDKSKQLEHFDAFDGAPFIEKATEGRVKFIDLSIPLFGIKVYDWVMSLEVGEHIPEKYESIFLDNLTNHARKGIVLSWAVPGQAGHGHVNCKSLKAVIQELNRRGFSHDKNSSSLLQSHCTIGWIRRNVNVYRRQPSSQFNPLWS